MPEENKQVEKVSVENDYIEQIDKLKAKIDSMVSVDDYNKLAAEHKDLMNKYIANDTVKKESVEPKDPKKKITEYFNAATHAASDLEGMSAMMDYADLFEETYGHDPLVGQDPQNPPTQSELDDSKSMREYIKDCIKSANGDPAVFKTLLVSNMVGFKTPSQKK